MSAAWIATQRTHRRRRACQPVTATSLKIRASVVQSIPGVAALVVQPAPTIELGRIGCSWGSGDAPVKMQANGAVEFGGSVEFNPESGVEVGVNAWLSVGASTGVSMMSDDSLLKD